MTNQNEIYAAILQAAQRYLLPGVWREMPSDPAFFCLPPDSDAFLRDLAAQFTEAQLLAAGVAERDPEAGLVWHPDLTVKDEPIWAIRRNANEAPVALVAQLRVVGHAGWALPVVLEEHRQKMLLLRPDPQIVVAYTMRDLAILRSQNLVVVPGGDWSTLTRPQMRELRHALTSGHSATELGMVGAATSDSTMDTLEVWGNARTLTFADWSASEMTDADIEPAMASWRFFLDLFRNYSPDFGGVRLWKPSPASLEKIKYQLRFDGAGRVRSGLHASLKKESRPIRDEPPPAIPAAQAIDQALRDWRLAERAARRDGTREKAFAHWMGLHELHRFAPLIEAAFLSNSPVERELLLSLVEISRLRATLSLVLLEQSLHSISERGPDATEVIPATQLKSFLALTDRQLRILKEIGQCQRRKTQEKIQEQTQQQAQEQSQHPKDQVPDWQRPPYRSQAFPRPGDSQPHGRPPEREASSTLPPRSPPWACRPRRFPC